MTSTNEKTTSILTINLVNQTLPICLLEKCTRSHVITLKPVPKYSSSCIKMNSMMSSFGPMARPIHELNITLIQRAESLVGLVTTGTQANQVHLHKSQKWPISLNIRIQIYLAMKLKLVRYLWL